MIPGLLGIGLQIGERGLIELPIEDHAWFVFIGAKRSIGAPILFNILILQAIHMGWEKF